jgi:hypothetical protein
MSKKPVDDDHSQEESAEPVDDLRDKFLEALNKKQGQQKGVVNDRSGRRSAAQNSSEAHTKRLLQRKSGAS